jgi:2-polyprenyl-3-methyl-5-hydroxy-6-metoxy-1,4-benzoquinol methylase
VVGLALESLRRIRWSNASTRLSVLPTLVVALNQGPRDGKSLLGLPALCDTGPMDAGSMDDADRTIAHYEQKPELTRLFEEPRGVLERLRTWDVLSRVLPAGGRVVDVGGGAGVHATWLAAQGHRVTMFDLASVHVEQAAASAGPDVDRPDFSIGRADGRYLPLRSESADVVMQMGPLYHLTDPEQRLAALGEARRATRPGGLIVVAAISRFAWLMDAYRHGWADRPAVQDSITYNLATGISQADPKPGDFWGYFHRPDELRSEVEAAGISDVSVYAVEGFAWMLPDLGPILDDNEQRQALLTQLRSVEQEEAMLGASAHLLAVGRG